MLRENGEIGEEIAQTFLRVQNFHGSPVHPKFTVSGLKYSQHPYNYSTYCDFRKNNYKKSYRRTKNPGHVCPPLVLSVGKRGLVLEGLIPFEIALQGIDMFKNIKDNGKSLTTFEKRV